ncbi:hypothetical protein ABPG75_001018 [Micractinium tetrahymenae]
MAVGVAEQKGEGAVLGKPLNTPAAWKAPDVLAAPQRWQYEFTDQDIEELLAATKHALATGKPVPELTTADFPLPTLGPKLREIVRNVTHGLGFHLLRGFPVDRLSRHEVVTAYFGLGTYWGPTLPQNAKGHVVGHIKNLRVGIDDTLPDGVTARVYQTNLAQPWHVDAGDTVSLLCLKAGQEGGLSRWASSHSVYNELLRRRPNLVEVLAQDFYWDRRGEENPGEEPWWKAPMITVRDGWFHFNFSDLVPKQAEARFGDIAKLSPLQLEAFAEVNCICEHPDFHLSYQLQPGDIQILSNFSQFHTRTSFTDPEPEEGGEDNRRHLLRIWNLPEGGRPDSAINPGFPTRRGIIRAGAKPYAPLEAEE